MRRLLASIVAMMLVLTLGMSTIAHAAELMREYGLNIGGARFWSGADVSSGRFGPAPTVEQCVKEAGLYPKDLPLVAYTADEITGHT